MQTRVEALHSAQEEWKMALKGSDQGILWGHELFEVADTLAESGALRRALTDTSRSEADRASLVDAVFGGKVAEAVRHILQFLVSERWSREADLNDAIESLAVQAMMDSASRQGRLSDVEEQLYRAMRLLGRERALRIALGDRGIPAEKREALARQVFVGLNPESLELLLRAIHRAPEPTIAYSLNTYVEVAGEYGHHLIASVTVAKELSAEQIARLSQILGQRYGTDVAVHVTVRPSVVGGIRIHVGEDVIDGTLATKLAHAKELITQ